jgi:hypothetical protein
LLHNTRLQADTEFEGHDFVTQDEGPTRTGQNWTINYDGTVDETGLVAYGAVLDFFNDESRLDRYRQVVQTYQEDRWWSWAVRK